MISQSGRKEGKWHRNFQPEKIGEIGHLKRFLPYFWKLFDNWTYFLWFMLIFYSVVVFLLIYLEYSPAVMFIVGVLWCSMFPSCGRNPPCEGLGPVVLYLAFVNHDNHNATVVTPWKINMEHTNHPFRKENDLPPMIMFHVNLPGCNAPACGKKRQPIWVSQHVSDRVGAVGPTSAQRLSVQRTFTWIIPEFYYLSKGGR